MSVDTRAQFLGKLEPDALLGFIKENIDPNAKSTIETEERTIDSKYHDGFIFLGEKEGVENRTSGFIDYTYNGENCKLYYIHCDTIWLDKDFFKKNIKQGTPELNGEVTELFLDLDVTAVEIMKKIAEFFEGYIKEKGSSDKWFHKVEKAK